MTVGGFRLGVDFGTSSTVAVLRWPDGRSKPLLFEGSPVLPSAVYAEPGGALAVGRDAVSGARAVPARFEPNPKRLIDDGFVLLGDREIAVVDLIAAVLGRVADEARRTAGGVPAAVTLTCPAAWAGPRRRVLAEAALRAGLGEVRILEEPVAAASYFAAMLGHRIPPGSAVVVYDLGAGTFDVSVVERVGDGFVTREVAGRGDIGGLDLDHALVRRIGDTCGAEDPQAWRRLTAADASADRRHRRQLWDDVRAAKERLSRHCDAELHLPVLERDVHVTRPEFEELAAPFIEETVRLTAATLARCGIARERIAGVFLVGGSSRIPLVATLVHRGLRIAPTALEQPELVVAEGSVLVGEPVAPVTVPMVPVVAPPGPPLPTVGSPWPAPAPTRRSAPRKRILGYVALALALLATAGLVGYRAWDGRSKPGTGARPSASGGAGSLPAGASGAPGGTPPAGVAAVPVAGQRLPDVWYDGSPPAVRDRDGKVVHLAEGPAVKTVTAVQTGWVVARAAGEDAVTVEYLDSGGSVRRRSDSPVTAFHIDSNGMRAALATTTGVTVWELTPDAGPAKSTRLPSEARAVGWAGDWVLVRIEAKDRYDVWNPQGGAYQTGPGNPLLTVFTTQTTTRSVVGLSAHDGCLTTFDASFEFAEGESTFCDTTLELEPSSRSGLPSGLPAVSPDGTMLAMRLGQPILLDIDTMMTGQADPYTRLDTGAVQVESMSWENSAVYLTTSTGAFLRCRHDDGTCQTLTVPVDGTSGGPHLAARFGH